MRPSTSTMKAILTALMIIVVFQGDSNVTKGARIIFLPAMGASSHVLSMIPLATALQQDGHDVTILQYYHDKQEKFKRDNLKFIYVEQIGIDVDTLIKRLQVWTRRGPSVWPMIRGILASGSNCRQTIVNPNYTSLYSHLKSGYWDLLFVDNVFHPCGVYVTSYAKNFSWIDYSTTLLLRTTRAARAVNAPISTEPSINSVNYEPKSFTFRLSNTVDEMIGLAFGVLVGKLLPYLTEGRISVGMNINNFHKSAIFSWAAMSPMLDFTLPQAGNTFTIDYSCPKPAALGKDFLEFVEDPSSKGTIIISFGHYAKWKHATTEIVHSISNGLSGMVNYRIIWQYDGDRNLVGNKAHIKLANWLPLPALLRHPKTVLLVNHVGIKSFLEAVCFAVPILAIPVFGDQYRNAALVRKRGLGVFLEKSTMNESSFRLAVETVLHKPTYKRNMEIMSAMTKDKIIDDLAKGRFWIDFYFRHPKAVSHMKLKGVEFNNFTFFDIDLIVVLSALLFLSFDILQKY